MHPQISLLYILCTQENTRIKRKHLSLKNHRKEKAVIIQHLYSLTVKGVEAANIGRKQTHFL